ncbi:uncharacterized protein LOC127240563 isoform X2 [Andrographis paniculata]|uniref:uncharacterized protein LOC127240563 isoform X2 n=1 Tax=Andrographis paniculata TaxID=175694 RepID=UPI0021E97CDD|nr:uncharacterized protein LOC127240563 isoform X2 [Andrographis paniculata]
MDSRRGPRAVSDPKVRQVGFFAPEAPRNPTSASPPVSDLSPASNHLSPVMIPPPRHAPADQPPRQLPNAPPTYTLLRPSAPAIDPSFPVGSYNPAPSVTTEFSEDSLSSALGGDGSPRKFATSLPSVGINSAAANPNGAANLPQDKKLQQQKDAGGGKPLKEKTTKAERRALQEAQRAAKAAGEGSKNSNVAANPGKPVKSSSQRKDNSSVATSDKKGIHHQPEKDRKKDIPQPRMQFDDENRVGKAKKRSALKQTEARNRVELFRHLPQYEHGTLFPVLESNFFQLEHVHPAVYKVGLQYLSGDISGGNARCIAMLQAFKESIKDYSTPPEKSLFQDLLTKINNYVAFLIDCRPLSVSMGNAIRFLKARIANLRSFNLSESEAKASLTSDIDRYISQKIILANKVIVKHAVSKIRDGDVLLTYALSSTVEMVFMHAHELGKQFRVVIVDSRPKLEGLKLVRRLVEKGIRCTYTHINAVSYVMHEVTRVFLGASSVLSNGTVYSRVGTACVAMVAHEFRVPVLICCEAYKFHERVQLDSFCFNELGDPNVLSQVLGRKEINLFEGLTNKETLQPLSLIYDTTPSDYISMIITDYGMIPPTSVPVIVREYCREQLWI